jgi:hypothetical protein
MSSLRPHNEPVNDICKRCNGKECIMNPEYLVWEDGDGERLPWYIQNDSRRHGGPAEQRAWDEEVGAPSRYLLCPECGTLEALEHEQPSPLAIQLQKSIQYELAKQQEKEPMESWQRAWRIGVAPQLSTAGLQALRQALVSNDPKLLQGATCSPPPLQCVQDWQVEAACAIGYCGWQGDGLNTVGEVEEHFARTCFEADKLLGEPAGCRWWLNWFDETPREQMRTALLAEIDRNLAERRGA